MKPLITMLAVIFMLAFSSAASASNRPRPKLDSAPINLCAPPWVELGLCPR
jgi:hypothetical protein